MQRAEYSLLKKRIANGGPDSTRALLDLRIAMNPGLNGVFTTSLETLGFRYAVILTLHEGVHAFINLITGNKSVLGALKLDESDRIIPQPFCVMLADLDSCSNASINFANSLHNLVDKYLGGQINLPN